mgnify:CR=1 FL=1
MINKSLFLVLILFIFTSCSKHPGPGGKANVNVHVVNGNANVPEVIVYVNFGGTSFPGESATGNTSINADQKGLAVFEDLHMGDYYFFVNHLIHDTVRSGGAHVIIENRKGEQHIVIDLDQENPF